VSCEVNNSAAMLEPDDSDPTSTSLDENSESGPGNEPSHSDSSDMSEANVSDHLSSGEKPENNIDISADNVNNFLSMDMESVADENSEGEPASNTGSEDPISTPNTDDGETEPSMEDSKCVQGEQRTSEFSALNLAHLNDADEQQDTAEENERNHFIYGKGGDIHVSAKSMSCRKCDEKFTKPSMLDLHYKDAHDMDTPYQCWRCSYQTCEYLSMESHMDSCLEPLHCVECGDMFDNAQLLLEHKIEEHSKDPMMKIQIPNVKLVDARGNRVKGKRTSLRLENAAAKRAKYTEEEDQDDESDEKLSNVKLRTPKCRRKRTRNKKAKSQSTAESESKDEDSGTTLYLCPRTDTGCSYQTMNMNNLLNHLRTHDDGKVYSCPYKDDGCKYETSKRGNLRSHLKTHLRCDRYKCELDSCDFKCSNKNALTRHNKSAHGLEENREFKCDICEKKFSRSQRLKVHLRIHSNDCPYICDQCGKCFASKQWMSVHQKIHHGTEKYICDICAKEFSAKTYLAKHVKTHDSAKKFLCDVCPKAFKRSDHLQCHKRMHTGEKPFQCAECGKTFKQICGLQAHKKVHSGEKPYVCTMCARAFTYNSSLKNGLCNLCRPVVAASKSENVYAASKIKTSPKCETLPKIPIDAASNTAPIRYEIPPTMPTAPNYGPPINTAVNYDIPPNSATKSENVHAISKLKTAPKFETLPKMPIDTASNTAPIRYEIPPTMMPTAPNYGPPTNTALLRYSEISPNTATKFETLQNFTAGVNYQMGPSPMDLAAAAVANFVPPNMQV
jgi:uncharacterized Zn-finger protein